MGRECRTRNKELNNNSDKRLALARQQFEHKNNDKIINNFDNYE